MASPPTLASPVVCVTFWETWTREVAVGTLDLNEALGSNPSAATDRPGDLGHIPERFSPQVPISRVEATVFIAVGVLVRVNEFMYVKYRKQCLPHSESSVHPGY